jgi:uncharacterized protein
MRINQLTVTILIVLLLASCSKTKETHYPNGTTKSRQEFKGKRENGVSTWFFDNGKKELEVNYVNGLPNGISTRWYYSGIKESQETYFDGKKNGTARKWDVNGKIAEELNYKNDSLHGAYILYYDNGLVKLKVITTMACSTAPGRTTT